MTCTTATRAIGVAGEFAFDSLINAANIRTVYFDNLTLIKIAQQSKIGQRRIQLAKPFLISEYGRPQRQADNKVRYKLNWGDVPAVVILDYIFGIDRVISWRGWTIGIDITLDTSTLMDKQGKLQGLREMWKAIGIDCTAILYLRLPQNAIAPDEDTIAAFKQECRAMVKGKQIISFSL